jgi:PfaB family protein
MPDLSNSIGLAIIGVDTIGPGHKDLDSFGFQIYRGLRTVGNSESLRISDADLNNLLRRTLFQAKMDSRNVGLITCRSEILARIDLSVFSNLKSEIYGNKLGFSSIFSTAADWLDGGTIEAVLLIDENKDLQTLTTMLISTSRYATDNSKQVFSSITGIAEINNAEHTKSADSLFEKALKSGRLLAKSIGLITSSTKLKTSPEIISPVELINVFPTNEGMSCALTGGDGGLLSLVKTVLCISHRIIPGTNDWITPAIPEIWEKSAFYIPTESRTWFCSTEQPVRYAATIVASEEGYNSVFIFCEEQSESHQPNSALQQELFVILPVFGKTPDILIQNLNSIRKDLVVQPDLRNYSRSVLDNWKNMLQPEDLVVCVLGQNKDELIREIDFALKGVLLAVEKQTEWRTPNGSYFASKPLGKSGSLSFVYPGAFNSYPGLGRDLFFLFPSLYSRLQKISSNLSNLLNEKMLYPRSITALSNSELEEAEKNLSADPLAMLISGTSLAALYTFLLRETFDIHPASSIGYSLGEISMMFASGVWMQADETSTALRSSPLFRTQLAGPQNAIRENWGLPLEQFESSESIWANYVLMASPETVNAAIKKENRVYMTHINTPRQVVIAGDPVACRRVIDELKCNSLQAPFNYALHCEAMKSEFDDLQTLHTWPVANQPGMTLYSAATYKPMPIDQKAIAFQIASGLCHQLDFPRLVNRAYEDGARIFIELGAGSNCSRWVDDTLKDLPHASFSINRKGVDDHTAVLQLLAKLISHHVPMNLSAILL